MSYLYYVHRRDGKYVYCRLDDSQFHCTQEVGPHWAAQGAVYGPCADGCPGHDTPEEARAHFWGERAE